MNLTTIVVIYLGGVALLVYIFMFADPNTDSIGGRMNIFITETIPGFVSAVLEKILPQKVYGKLARSWNWVVNERNPLLQLLYLVLHLGCFGLYAYFAWPRLPENDIFMSLFLLSLCMLSFHLACTVSPGFIEKDSVVKYSNYAPDDFIYDSDRQCVTCKIPKLARSKHCRLCGGCVARYDHHCGWLNQCVGEDNYRYFLLFLLLHVITFWFGAVTMGSIFVEEIFKRNLLKTTFYNSRTKTPIPSSYTIILQYFLVKDGILVGVFMLCFVMAMTLTGFFTYHLWLAIRNTTTNETFKWASARSYHKEALARARTANEIAAASGADEVAEPVPPLPPNSYDKGLLNNLGEVFYPRSIRPREQAKTTAPGGNSRRRGSGGGGAKMKGS